MNNNNTYKDINNLSDEIKNGLGIKQLDAGIIYENINGNFNIIAFSDLKD